MRREDNTMEYKQSINKLLALICFIRLQSTNLMTSLTLVTLAETTFTIV